MTLHKPYEDGHGALEFETGFGDFRLNASGPTDQVSEVMAAFPYPPKNCDDAIAAIAILDENIKQRQEQIASNIAVTTGKKYLDAYLAVRNNFNTYVAKSRCVQSAIDKADQSFEQEWKSLLDTEEQKQSGKKTGDSLVIYFAIGLLVVGAGIIIWKKSKKT